MLLFFGASVIPAEDIEKASVELMSAIWHVDDDGNEYPNPDFNDIQDAINAATGGDEIWVYAGLYDENIEIDKSLIIIGGFNGTSVIDGGGNGDVVRITTASVQFEKFTIQNSGDNNEGDIYDAGIHVLSGLNTIAQNRIVDNLGNGMSLTKATGNEINNNIVSDNGHHGIGLYSLLTDGNTLSENTIENNGEDGIHCFRGQGNFILENHISGNDGNGIYLWRSRVTTIDRNFIGNSGEYGIFFELMCIANSVNFNNISGNEDQGIFLKFQCDANSFTCNNFMDNNGEGEFLYCCHVGFLSCFLNGWRENYWDNHDPIIPNWWYLIWGRWGFIPWPNWDLYPVGEPWPWPPEE